MANGDQVIEPTFGHISKRHVNVMSQDLHLSFEPNLTSRGSQT